MKVSEIIDVLDNSEDIIKVKFNGFLVWPTIRYIVIQYLINNINKLDDANTSNVKLFSLKNIFGVIRSIIKCPFWGPKKSIIFFNTASSNVKDFQGLYFNRIINYFHLYNPQDSWVIENPIGFNHLVPHKQLPYSRLSLNLYSEIAVNCIFLFDKQNSFEARDLISDIFKNINKVLIPFELKIDDEKLENSLVKSILRMKSIYVSYQKLFKMKKNKIIVIEDGYYGLEKSTIIKAAKDLNIRVIEPQHGFINENHPAYNYGKQIHKEVEYKKYLPDVLLCYGEFWAKSINIPNEKYVIGNPHLEESLQLLIEPTVINKILVIGSGVTVKETNCLLNELLLIKPTDFEIYYRPHPQESSQVSLRYNDLIRSGIKIDVKELYHSLAESKIIIGELSTVTFEAVALKKKVFLFHSSYTKAYLTNHIKYLKNISMDNVSTIFENYTLSEEAKNYYWKNDWKRSYSQLYDSFKI